jgi:hypothetical protein
MKVITATNETGKSVIVTTDVPEQFYSTIHLTEEQEAYVIDEIGSDYSLEICEV